MFAEASCLKFINSWTHWGWVMHVCVSKLNINGSDNGLAPTMWQTIHYLNQWWNVVNWTLRNKLQWNFKWNPYIFIQEMYLNVSSAKWRPLCLCLNVLNHLPIWEIKWIVSKLGQHHAYWWPGSFCRQVISSHDTDWQISWWVIFKNTSRE